jgi:GTP-binding protein
MVDGCMLVVDAQEGPMPQTRYVLSKALARGLKPVVVLNKCDREGARLGQVENEIFDLFVALEASDEQLDFPIVYCSAREGWTSSSPEAATNPKERHGMGHLLSVLADNLPSPRILGDENAPFKMLVSQMDSDIFIGKLVIGRIMSGKVKPGDPVVAMDRTGRQLEAGKVTKLFGRRGGTNIPLEEGIAGDIVQLAGLQTPLPTATVCAPTVTRPLYADPIDPPTISMAFGVNDSPLGGKEGSKLTSTMIADRLLKEAATAAALPQQVQSRRLTSLLLLVVATA